MCCIYLSIQPFRNFLGESKPITLLQTIDGSWSEWSQWSSCSKSCLSKSDGFALGERERSRKCDNPEPRNKGRQCLGEVTESFQCSAELCDGIWQSWSLWSACSESCGTGSRSRSRKCSDLQCKTLRENSQYTSLKFDDGIVEIDSGCNDHDCPRE